MIKHHILNHLFTQFSEPVKERPTLDGLSFAQINADQNDRMVRQIEESEILAALMSLPDEKAPGVDDFPIDVIKKS